MPKTTDPHGLIQETYLSATEDPDNLSLKVATLDAALERRPAGASRRRRRGAGSVGHMLK